MKKLMIDMDNCITNAKFLETVNDFLGTNYRLEELDSFFLQDLVGDKKEEYWQYMLDKNFYEGATLLEGCYEAIEKLNQKYDLFIATDYLYPDSNPDISGKNLMNKYYYLKQALPFLTPDQYIFLRRKDLVHWDIAIDDQVKNLKTADEKLLLTAWHNKKIENKELEEQGVVRVNSWQEILERLDK